MPLLKLKPRIELKSVREIELMRAASQLVALTLDLVGSMVRPGVTTGELDRAAESFIRAQGGIPAFKGYGPRDNPFPATLCLSVNEQVVHGIPGSRVLVEGDLLSVDCGVQKAGFFGDSARTFAVGQITDEQQRLLDVTARCLDLAIEQMVEGRQLGDLSAAVQQHAEAAGMGVVRDLVGHGIGSKMHMDPAVPNFGRPRTGPKLLAGMVFAVEPMINLGTWRVTTLADGWTIVTADGAPSAHFEHTVVVGKDRADVLSRLN